MRSTVQGITFELLRMLLVGAIIGISGGVAANLFVLGVLEIDALVTSEPMRASFLGFDLTRWLALVAAAFLIFGLKRAFDMDRWHGPADTILSTHRVSTPFPVREGFLSTTAAFISASGGASVGQYGPVLHFGSSVGALVRSVLPTKLKPEVYVACGAAAAISAGFGAPIAGVVFACEAILRHFSVRALAPIIVSSVIASASTRLFFNRSSPYIVDVSGLDWNLLPLVLLLGASSALIAVLFMSSLLKLITWAKQQNRELLFILIAATGMAMIGSIVPEALGLGTNTVNQFLSGERVASDVALILVAKFIATLLCLGFGLFGGVFSPAVFMGASVGSLFGILAVTLGYPDVALTLMAVCGVAAVTSSVVGAPIAIVIIVLEFTRSYEFALTSLIAVAMSSFISTRIFGYSFFDRQLKGRGYDLRMGRETLALLDYGISKLNFESGSVFNTWSLGSDVLLELTTSNRTEGYIIDDGGQLVGVITIIDAMSNQDRQVGTFMSNEFHFLSLQQDLLSAMETAQSFVGEAIPVVDEDNKYTGCITEGAILGAALEQQEAIRGYERN
ncbi:MAG: voltage-gated chloride channel [Gammaproteobacteria bacterium]|nr:voltage-gated chloride channel [Gammaproteobacteria bacterium]